MTDAKIHQPSEQYIFTRRCPRSRWLRGHGVDKVNDYADTSMTTRTLFENFESFSQILKEQSDKKGIWVFLHIQ